MRAKRGRVGGYELRPDAKRAGKERPEHITTRQFTRLSEDEQKMYQPAEQKMVPSVSYSYYFGETKFAARQSYKQWHTMLFEEVGEKWGLQRGEDTSLMTADERKEHRKKNKRQLERERLEALEKAEAAEKTAANYNEVVLRLQGKQQELSSAQTELDEVNGKRDDAQKELTALEQKVEELANAVGDPNETVEVTGFWDSVFAYNPTNSGAVVGNLKAKGKMKVRMMDVIMAAFEEIEKVKDRKKPLFMDADDFRKEQDRDIKSIMTDMQTILRSFDSTHVQELTRRSRAIVKQKLRQNAVAVKKIREYDEMQKMGISKGSYMEAKEKADQFDKAHKVLEASWAGLWNAVEVVTDPNLDEYEMSASGKDVVRGALGKNPRGRLNETGWLLKLANAVRNIDPRTETEVWKIGAEAGVTYLKSLGLDMAEGVANDIEDVAAATACRGPSRDTR